LWVGVKDNKCYYRDTFYTNQNDCGAQGHDWDELSTHSGEYCWEDITSSDPTYADCCQGTSGDPCGTGGDRFWTGSIPCTAGPGGNACQNGGTPAGADGSCTCNCATGYEGGNCETAGACQTGPGGAPCQNGGTPLGNTGSCTCICDSKTTGDHCETCATGWGGANCATSLGPDPDFYYSNDLETVPNADSAWDTEDIACGVDHFVSLTSDAYGNCDYVCRSCNGDGAGNTGKQLFLAEYETQRDYKEYSSVTAGFAHGKCCINGHHKVCQQLLLTYKNNCADELDDKGHNIEGVGDRECAA
jgi:hypothetical protein